MMLCTSGGADCGAIPELVAGVERLEYTGAVAGACICTDCCGPLALFATGCTGAGCWATAGAPGCKTVAAASGCVGVTDWIAAPSGEEANCGIGTSTGL